MDSEPKSLDALLKDQPPMPTEPVTAGQPLHTLTTSELARYRRELEHALKAVPARATVCEQLRDKLNQIMAETSVREGTMTRTAAQAALTGYQGTFCGRLDQVRYGREAVGRYLGDCPARDDAVLITSELFSNAVLYSRSGRNGFLILRADLHAAYLVIQVEDEGGAWACRPRDNRPHGLDIVEALTGPDNWGVETTANSRKVWARLDFSHP